jgi:hypothetical protein
MIMQDYKNSKPVAEKTNAGEIIGAVCFAIILIFLHLQSLLHLKII